MGRTAARLRAEGTAVVMLDLTAVGQHLTVEQSYDGLLRLLGSQVVLEVALEEFWQAESRLNPLLRFTTAIRHRPFRPARATLLAVAAALLVAELSFLCFWRFRIWFPWLLIVAIEIPVALLSSVIIATIKLHIEQESGFSPA